jgi:hypothetical protein
MKHNISAGSSSLSVNNFEEKKHYNNKMGEKSGKIKEISSSGLIRGRNPSTSSLSNLPHPSSFALINAAPSISAALSTTSSNRRRQSTQLAKNYDALLD